MLLLFPKVESFTETYIKFLKIYYSFIYLSLLIEIDVFHLVLGINSFMMESLSYINQSIDLQSKGPPS